jgi:hypothetical protein
LTEGTRTIRGAITGHEATGLELTVLQRHDGRREKRTAVGAWQQQWDAWLAASSAR